jgi:hypothetical protein
MKMKLTLCNLKVSCIFFMLFAISFGLKAQNQNQLAAKMGEGDFYAFKFDEKKKAVSAGKAAWGIKFVKSGQKDGSGNEIITELILNRAGIVEENYKPDLTNHPAYFFNDAVRVMYMDGKIFYYTWRSATAEIKYILAPSGESVSGLHDDWKKKLETFQAQILAQQKDARMQIAEQKSQQEEAEKLANSLKGKNLKEIRIKWLDKPANLGHLSKVKYGIEAELTDGKILKTSNLGGKMPWDDFSITVEGAEFGEEVVTVWNSCEKIPNDRIFITAKSKHGGQTATASLDIPFTESFVGDFGGGEGGRFALYSYPGHRGYNGMNLNLKAVGDKTKAGHFVIKVEIIDGATGEVLHRLKLAPTAALRIQVNGGDGSFGTKSTKAGNGGDGGNVTLMQDPSASSLQITVTNRGGVGGKNKEMYNGDGVPGKDGRFIVNKQAVSLSW